MGGATLYWGSNKMSSPNIKNFDESAIGPLGQRVRALWNANDWKLSDAEFFTWQAHLQDCGYTYGDLEKAMYEYVHQGGIHKPRFGDIRQLLQLHKRRRTGKKKKLVVQDRNTTSDGLSVTGCIEQMLKELPLSREKQLELYDLLGGKNNRRVLT